MPQDRAKHFFHMLSVLVPKERATTYPDDWLCDSSQQCLSRTVLGSTAQKSPDTIYKERTKAQVGMSSHLDSIFHCCQCQPPESVAHGHEIFLLGRYFESLSSTFGTWQGGRFASPNSVSKPMYTRHLGIAGQSNAQKWENIRLKKKDKNTTERLAMRRGKKKRALRQEASETAVELVGDLFSSFSRACGLFVFPFLFPGNKLSWKWKSALINVCFINFVVLLCLMNIKAEEITIIHNVIDFIIIVAIKRVDIFSHHLYKGSEIISQTLFLQ